MYPVFQLKPTAQNLSKGSHNLMSGEIMGSIHLGKCLIGTTVRKQYKRHTYMCCGAGAGALSHLAILCTKFFIKHIHPDLAPYLGEV